VIPTTNHLITAHLHVGRHQVNPDNVPPNQSTTRIGILTLPAPTVKINLDASVRSKQVHDRLLLTAYLGIRCCRAVLIVHGTPDECTCSDLRKFNSNWNRHA
jgi:hypothetical protein